MRIASIARVFRRGLAAALLCSIACIHQPRVASERWVEAESEHFVLRGDLSDDESREALRNLEQVREGLRTGSWHAASDPPGKTHVILLGDEDELNEYARQGVLGFAAADPFEAPLLVASLSQRLDQVTVLKHEMAHNIDNAFLLRQPRWLSEGLASYLETLRIKPDGSGVTIGEVNQQRFEHLRRDPRFNLKWLLQVGPELYSMKQEAVDGFYAQSWFLVHYLMNERRQQLNAWVDRLSLAEEPQAAWEKSFGKLDAVQLDRELTRYLSHGQFHTYTFALPAFKTRMNVRELPQADVLAELALLRSISFGRATSATAARAAWEAEEARRADPHSALAAGIWTATGTRPREAQIAAARAVIEGNPKDARGYELLGLALGPGVAQEQVAAFEEAVRLQPDDARALEHLSFGYLTLDREADALAAARKAALLSPGNPSYLDALALALAANGHCQEAPALEERAIDMVPDRASAQVAEHLRERLDEFERVCSARRAGTKARFVPAEENPPSGTAPPAPR